MRAVVTTIFFNAKTQRRGDAKKNSGDEIQAGRATSAFARLRRDKPCAPSFNTSTQRRAGD